MINIKDIITQQKKFFISGKTKDVKFRKEKLQLLLETVRKFESKTLTACFTDFGKPEHESYITEIGSVCSEIQNAIKHIDRWIKPEKVSGSLALFPSSSYIYREPFGRVLVLGTWNYPHQTCLSPLIGSIAAGNCTILKPSELTPACASVLAEMLNSTFDPGYIYVIEGDVTVSKELLQQQFDHIFFTGSPGVGKQIIASAAQHLTPVTLELGGKSPCIVDKDADLDTTARRIIWGKMFNAGQTCIAPDYLLVHESVRDNLIGLLIKNIKEFYPDATLNNKDYAKIVNLHHFNRLKNLLIGQKIIYGGALNEASRFISPTLVDSPDLNAPIMQEEIFGPVLPIFSYSDLDSVIQDILDRPKPLSLYLFSNDKEVQDKILNSISFGGGCINDTCLHFGNINLPFGGVGNSGMGAYHGKYTFEVLSRRKAVLKKPFWLDFRFRYPPYAGKLWIVRKLLG